MFAVGGDAEEGVLVLGVDGVSQIGGAKPVGVAEVDTEHVITSKALPSVAGKEKGVAVGTEERTFLVAGSVDRRS